MFWNNAMQDYASIINLEFSNFVVLFIESAARAFGCKNLRAPASSSDHIKSFSYGLCLLFPVISLKLFFPDP